MDRVRTLALAIDSMMALPDGRSLNALDDRLRLAVRSGGLDSYRISSVDGCELTSDEVAAAAIEFLVDSSADGKIAVERAELLVNERERFDPTALALGGLIVLLLQTEVKLKRNGEGEWTFEFRKTPLQGKALVDLIAKMADFFK